MTPSPFPITWPSQMAPLVPQLRRLQHAANMLNVNEFCEAQGWPRNEYSEAKFRDFQRLGDMHRFDDSVLRNAIEFYEREQVAQARGAEYRAAQGTVS